MPITLKDQAAVVGIGETEYSKNSGRSELQLGCEALRAAIRDCGVDPKEIDGMASFTMDSTDEIELARAAGIGELRFLSKAHHGGGAATATLHQAAMAVATGAANYVVCYRTLNGRSGHRFSMGVSGDMITSDTMPGDTMKLSGSVKSVDASAATAEVEVVGANAWGNHVTGTVTVELPGGGA